MITPPIFRLTIATVLLSNGAKLEVVHDLTEKEFDCTVAMWAEFTDTFAVESLCDFSRHINPDKIFVTEKKHAEIVQKYQVQHFTKEQYEAQNN